MRRALLLAICALMAAPVLAKPPKTRKKAPRVRHARVYHRAGPCWFEMPISASFAAELGDGLGLAQVSMTAARVAAGVAPTLRCLKGRLQVRSALAFAERGGSALDERALSARVGLTGRPWSRWELGLWGHTRALERPNWPDPYQPVLDGTAQPTGALLGTGRWGGLWAGLEAAATVRLPGRVSLGLSVDWTRRWDQQDASFDAVLRPDHLTPHDGDTTHARVTVAARRGPWRLSAEAGLQVRRYRYVFARDAVTGATHAAPGGAAPNPLLETLGGGASARAWVQTPVRGLAVELGLGVEGDADLFQGYESAWAVSGRLGATLRPVRGLRTSARYDVTYRRYTLDGYGETESHPPLEEDTVRSRLSQRLRLGVSYRLLKVLEPYAEAALLWSDTNFPDYAPYEYPNHSPYSVDFDARRWELQLGMRISL